MSPSEPGWDVTLRPRLTPYFAYGAAFVIAAAHVAVGFLLKIGSTGVVFQTADQVAMTATSGPGFSLMQEGLGYASITETPCVIVNCQRWGPSTGQPTKSAQGDVMQAIWGTHGDHPVIVLTASIHFEAPIAIVIPAFSVANAAVGVHSFLIFRLHQQARLAAERLSEKRAASLFLRLALSRAHAEEAPAILSTAAAMFLGHQAPATLPLQAGERHVLADAFDQAAQTGEQRCRHHRRNLPAHDEPHQVQHFVVEDFAVLDDALEGLLR